MGIRIHKVMGWGLDDVRHEDDSPTDPRFNPKFEQDEEYQEFLYSFPKDFLTWVSSHEDEAIAICRSANGEYGSKHPCLDMVLQGFAQDILDASREAPDDPFVYDGEYGAPNVFLIVPIEQGKRWSRYDDAIDYYETPDAEPMVNRLDHRCGIYPWTNMLKIPGTPEVPDIVKKYLGDQKKFSSINPATFNQLTGRWVENRPAPNAEVAEYLLANYRPLIPDSVLLMTHYCKIFTDWQNTVQQLRPMIYTYWG